MGKSAIDAPRGNYFRLDPSDVVLVTEPDHPLFDARALLPPDEGLVLSLMQAGNKEPILVRKAGEKLEVVDGRRRVVAAREANKRIRAEGGTPVTVKAIVESGEDSDHVGTMVLCNEHRLADNPINKARKCKRLLDLNGGDTAAAATYFGVSQEAIRNWMTLLSCERSVIKAVEDGKVPATAAWQLAKLTKEEQKAKLEELIAAGHVTVTETKAKVAGVKKAAKGDDGDAPSPAPKKRFLRKLTERLGENGHGENSTLKDAHVIFRFVLGEITQESLLRHLPELRPIVKEVLAPKAKESSEATA